MNCLRTFTIGTLKLMTWIDPEPDPNDPDGCLCAESCGKICDDCYATHWAVEVK